MPKRPPVHKSHARVGKRHKKPRLTSTQRGYGVLWRAARTAYLAEHSFCECGARATEIDHIVAHRGNIRLFWSRNNWAARCKPCHSRKTALYDGGFGNAQVTA